MENKQISELTTGSLTDDNDVFIIDTYEGTTVKIPYSVLASMILQTSLGAGTGVSITEDGESEVFRVVVSATGGSGSGTVWYITDTEPSDPAVNNVWLHTDVANYGDIDVYNGTAWETRGNMKGADGATGTAATISVGTVTTGAAGTNASVTNSGTTSSAVLDFTIPRGDTGAVGAQGYSISATVTTITGGHRVTLHSTDPNVSDTSFDVMDGSGSSTTYTAGDGIDITNNEISFKLGNGLRVNAITGNIDVTGGGSGGITRTTLWFNNWSLTNVDITLSDDFRNYDFIEFWMIRTTNGRQLHPEIYPVDMLNTLYEQQVTGGTNQMVFTFYGSEYSSWEFSSATGLHFLGSNAIFLGKIVGVKIG